jgi:hypothetical protein
MCVKVSLKASLQKRNVSLKAKYTKNLNQITS